MMRFLIAGMLMLSVGLSGCGGGKAASGDAGQTKLEAKIEKLGHLWGRGQMCEVTLNDRSLTQVKKYLHEHTKTQEEADRIYEDVFMAAVKKEEGGSYADAECTDEENAKLTEDVRKAWVRLEYNKL